MLLQSNKIQSSAIVPHQDVFFLRKLMMGRLIATVYRQSDASKQNSQKTDNLVSQCNSRISHSFLVLHMGLCFNHPTHSDNAANVILLRKCLDACEYQHTFLYHFTTHITSCISGWGNRIHYVCLSVCDGLWDLCCASLACIVEKHDSDAMWRHSMTSGGQNDYEMGDAWMLGWFHCTRFWISVKLWNTKQMFVFSWISVLSSCIHQYMCTRDNHLT